MRCSDDCFESGFVYMTSIVAINSIDIKMNNYVE